MTLISARFASRSDSTNIYEWRNDPLTRRMSKNKKLIEWSNHVNWFNKSFVSNDIKLIICELGYRDKIAFIKFQINNEVALVSMNLNPIHRGQGLAKYCLIDSIDLFKKSCVNIKLLIAEIKGENIASQKTFKSVGFKLNKIKDEFGYYEKILELN